MNRKEQLNVLKDIPTWQEPDINIYESAYYVNYKNLHIISQEDNCKNPSKK